MNLSSDSRQTLRRHTAVLLMAALLLSQALGLLHGVAHAGLSRPASADSTQARLFGAGDRPGASDSRGLPRQDSHPPHHSCTVYDALSLATILPTAHRPAFILQDPVHPGPTPALASWDAPVRHYFSPRAPPR
jgi:hypothetical protein